MRSLGGIKGVVGVSVSVRVSLVRSSSSESWRGDLLWYVVVL